MPTAPTNPSGASTADAAASQAREFVSFPSREGVTHVRPGTVDAIEACSAESYHLVIDGVRLLVNVSTIDAMKALSPA